MQSQRQIYIRLHSNPEGGCSKKTKSIAHLLLLEEHAGAGAHLALDALPGLVVRHHRFLQLVLGLKSTRNQINQPAKADITTQSQYVSHPRHPALTRAIRWSHSASVRNPLWRNALIATRNHTAVRVARDLGFGGRRAEQSGSLGGRSDRHLGRHESWTTREGSKALAPRLDAVAQTRPSPRRSATAAARKRWRWKAMVPRDGRRTKGEALGLAKKKQGRRHVNRPGADAEYHC